MDTFLRFDRDENHKNWLKAIVVLRSLQELLERFTDRQIDIFHRELRMECGPSLCVKTCDFKNWNPRPNQIPSLNCEVCSRWRDVIRSYHTSQCGKVMWVNSEPHLWSQNKWEVAKVYMTGGHKNHRSVGDFDIAALLSLMTQCKHFKRFELGDLCSQVANVRNNTMHSASFQLKREDLHNYLERIRALGEVLAKHDSEFASLSGDIDEIRNLDFRLILPDNMAAEEIQAQHGKELEDTLFTAVKFENENQDFFGSKTEKLKQLLSECEKKMQTRCRRQEEMIAQRDKDLLNMHYAAAQKDADHSRTRMELKRLERKMAEQEQEMREMHWAAAQKDAKHSRTRMELKRLEKKMAEQEQEMREMHWAAAQKDADHSCTRMELKRLERKMAEQEQEMREMHWLENGRRGHAQVTSMDVIPKTPSVLEALLIVIGTVILVFIMGIVFILLLLLIITNIPGGKSKTRGRKYRQYT